MLSWEKLNQSDFDRTVELLVTRRYKREHPELSVQAIDGRGGDGGIDIDVREPVTGKLLKIYQLKFFPEGFSGGHRQRRNQIRNSFEKAAALHPPVWALVIPRNFTTNERKWITTLLKDSGIHPEFVGRAELDSLQADDPNAIALAQRTSDREALSIVGRKSAALLTMEDAMAEAMRTAARTDTISPNWGIEVRTRGNLIQNTLFAKHPRASEREPLSIHLETDFKHDAELGEKFKESFKYGLTEPIVLPSNVIKSFEHIGSDWFARSSANVLSVVEIHPSTESQYSLPVTLRVRGSENQTPRVLRGTTTFMTSGEEGSLVRTAFAGGLSITWKLDFDPSGGASVTPTFVPEGETATDVYRSLLSLTEIREGASVELEIDGNKIKLVAGSDISAFSVNQDALELAEDLALIERETGVQFAFPVELVAIERIWIRVVRRLFEGECVIAPEIQSFRFRFSGVLDDKIEMLLTQPCAFLATHAAWSAEICGETVVVGDVAYYHPGIQIPDAEAHLEALRAGTGADRPGEAVPAESGIGFRLYSPSRMNANATVVPVPWGITGILEPAEIRQLEESQ